MKYTITCEKCGEKIVEGLGYENAAHIARRFSHIGDLQCPKCTKLVYGPLTEEMLTEALEVCDDAHPYVGADHLYGPSARFVLRLLIDGGLATYTPTLDGCTAEDWRDWLLDLARKG